MPDIFLSYNREDQARAKLFAEAFAGQGFSVWWDVGLKTGEAYDEVTEATLRGAKAFVVADASDAVRQLRAMGSLREGIEQRLTTMFDQTSPAAGVFTAAFLKAWDETPEHGERSSQP